MATAGYGNDRGTVCNLKLRSSVWQDEWGVGAPPLGGTPIPSQ